MVSKNEAYIGGEHIGLVGPNKNPNTCYHHFANFLFICFVCWESERESRERGNRMLRRERQTRKRCASRSVSDSDIYGYRWPIWPNDSTLESQTTCCICHWLECGFFFLNCRIETNIKKNPLHSFRGGCSMFVCTGNNTMDIMSQFFFMRPDGLKGAWLTVTGNKIIEPEWIGKLGPEDCSFFFEGSWQI